MVSVVFHWAVYIKQFTNLCLLVVTFATTQISSKRSIYPHDLGVESNAYLCKAAKRYNLVLTKPESIHYTGTAFQIPDIVQARRFVSRKNTIIQAKLWQCLTPCLMSVLSSISPMRKDGVVPD